ncbi:MMPL family transporter [Microbacterium sp. X-17]|uniref:MMPL family transporter n=1 Tax=Microbacterium sp. X-17 TaxID=3144404 RepID=UPI0031F522DC
MSTLLFSLGRWSFRHPWRVLVGWLVLLALAGGGAALFAKGIDNTFSIPGTESQAGLEQLNNTFPQAAGTSAQFIVVAPAGSRVDQPPYTTSIERTISQIEGVDGVLAVTDPFSNTVTGLVSDDGSAALVRFQFAGQATDVSATTRSTLKGITADLQSALPAGSTVALGGDLFSQSLPTVSITEALGLLIALVVLIVTFRSFVTAGLPLVTALVGVSLSILLIVGATAFATVSSTTPLLALMLGLAVGIDYALFIIARQQDQVRSGIDPEESAALAVGTAGSAVVFAGVTVLIALIGLSFANIPFLTTMGIAAAAAVAVAVLVALTLTPALLGFVKGRVVGWRPRRKGAAVTAPTSGPKRINRWVALITRHPIVTTAAVVVTLGIVAIPAASLTLALPNAGMLPEENQARQTYDLVAEHFGPGYNGPLVMTGTIVTSNDPVTLMKDLGADIAKIPGVKEVTLATPNQTADTGIVNVIPTTAPDDPATSDLVRELRSQHDRLLAQYGVDLKVTGFTAIAIDISDRLAQALLPFGIFVVGLSLVLLAIVFRSIWVPITAALGYLLSVVAAFGIVAAVFEWGWGAELLNVAKVGPVISFLPIILMGVLFGLAMDYEVFLVSRMREDYVHSRETGARPRAIAAVRTGFTASARVVTAAAVIMFGVFAAFIPDGDATIKPMALGLASGVAIDAFLVRMTLIPAVMALLGHHAWWLPRWLVRRLPHLDIEGEAVERERRLEDWPEPETTAVVVAEDLELADDDARAFAGVDLRVEPGGTLLVTGADARARRALLLTLAGRVAPTGGRLKVHGHLLPGRGAWVRARVGVALLDGSADPARELRTALRGGTRTVVVDGLDAAVATSQPDQLTAALRDAARTDAATIIASAADAGAARSLLAEAGRGAAHVLTLPASPPGPPTPSTPASHEVTA